MKYTINNERISKEEYIDFLKRSDLGFQYPKERFEERIGKLVLNASISIVAKDEQGLIIGVIFGITDFAYWLFITDLGVDRNWVGQGIGSRLMKAAHQIAGGEKDIAVYTVFNDSAISFYEKNGFIKSEEVMEYNHIEWTNFVVK